MKVVGIMFMSLVFIGCGMEEGEYVSYDKPSTPDSEIATEDLTEDEQVEEGGCDAEALKVFRLMVSPAIDSSCSNCHDADHSLPLLNGQHSSNRVSLTDWTGEDAQKLFSWISNPGVHNGGDQSAALPLSQIEAWIEAEQLCTEG